jgi:hypothetical protein
MEIRSFASTTIRRIASLASCHNMPVIRRVQRMKKPGHVATSRSVETEKLP